MIDLWAGLAIIVLVSGKYRDETVSSIGGLAMIGVTFTYFMGWYLMTAGAYGMATFALDHVGY